MPLKDTLALPTKTDAIAVRPESLPVPTGKTERRELRSVNSKTFLHPEKAADGKEIRTFTGQLGAVCYRDDNGELRSIDTTIRNLGTHVGIEWAPYRFKLHETGIGFDFESREGGTCTVTLTGIGGEKFEDSPKPEVDGNVVTYRDVRPGLDIVFKCLNQRVKTLRILRDDKAPRTFDWAVVSDKPELIGTMLVGRDAAGSPLDLSSSVDGDVIHETWTGKTKVILDPATRIRSRSDEVTYPVEIDPTVNVSIDATTNDGSETESGSPSWFYYVYSFVFGHATYKRHPGWRFTNITVPNGATIDSATLTFYCNGTGSGTATGNLYGRAADNPGVFNGSNLPHAVTKTTASTAVSVGSTGSKAYSVASQVQEIVNRAGWASGNAMAFPLIATNTTLNFVYIEDFQNAASHEASLSITYTAAAGGTAGNLLLLGCG